jgi:hypothetical protein
VLFIDGDYFGKQNCLILYRDYPSKKTVFWRWSQGEYLWEIYTDLGFLIKNGYPLKGVVSDGKKSIVNAVKEIEKRLFITEGKLLPLQRCLVHLQMAAETYLTQHPKTQAGKELKGLSSFINSINNHYEKKIFIKWFERWEKRHLIFLQEKSWGINPKTERKYWWYTHKYLRKTWRLLKNALPAMFVYLRYSFLPKDTNSLEGYFSQLDSLIKRHRGLKREKMPQLISWYLLFKHYPNLKLQDVEEDGV